MRRLIDELGMRDITIIYGMTETLISTQTARDDAIEQRVATVGRVHPHLEIKIVDLEGRTVPRGIQGEICTRGCSVMPGYWNGAEQTAAAIDGARWMHTVTSARWPVYIRAGTDITTKCAQALHMTTDKQRSDEFVRLRAGATRSHAEIVDRERPAVLIVCAGGTEIVERAVRECVDGTRSRL